MSTHVPGFQSFFYGFLHHFALAKLYIATSSIRAEENSRYDWVNKVKNGLILNHFYQIKIKRKDLHELKYS